MTKLQKLTRLGICYVAMAIGSAIGTAGCGEDGSDGSATRLSEGEVAQFVDGHNAVRADVTAPTDYSGTWAPLPQVAWSSAIAATAQAWANELATNRGCTLDHAPNRDYGENLAMGSGLSPVEALAMWASEKPKYVWSANYSMADFNSGSGHYTQLVWRQTAEIGCGIAVCSNNRQIVCCRYSPAGNVIGRPVF